MEIKEFLTIANRRGFVRELPSLCNLAITYNRLAMHEVRKPLIVEIVVLYDPYYHESTGTMIGAVEVNIAGRIDAIKRLY